VKKQFLMSTVLVATLMLGVMAVNAFDDTANTNKIPLKDAEKLKAIIPKTFVDADALIAPIRNRFLLWTHDGTHIMWGSYGGGYFSGTDNLGKQAWGIYGKGIFAGFYDGNFFYGMYRNGNWKAIYLFDGKITQGRYVTFPTAIPIVDGGATTVSSGTTG